MNDIATNVALATLTFWIGRTQDAATVPALPALEDREQRLLHRTAWRLMGHEPPRDRTEWPTFDRRQTLQSIFSRVRPATRDSARSMPTSPLFVRRAALALHEQVLFPVTAEEEVAGASDPALALGAELVALDAQSLSPTIRLERLLYAMQRYAWCLPSPLPAVSLYDFARTHAAIAAARALHDDTVFLLGGDLSGVQDFIYTLTADGATKQLRGRSFYLQLLTEATAHYVLVQMHLPLTNLLYSGGGRFYLVLPGPAGERVPELRHELGRRLLQRHGGALYVALGGAPFAEDGDSQQAWQQVNDALNADKLRRFATLDADTLHQVLFTPRQPDLPPDVSESPELVAKDKLSLSLEELVPRLHNAHYLQVQPRSPRTLSAPYTLEPREWHQVLQEFGLAIRPLDATEVAPVHRPTRLLAIEDRPEAERSQIQTQIGTGGVLGMRYTVTVAPLATGADVQDYQAYGLESADTQPLRVGNVKPFNLLAAQSRGIKRLGVLRMDVDDLGDLFGQRLERVPGIAGLAYTAALSAALSHFFEGWVGQCCRQVNQRQQDAQDASDADHGSVYAIYSGGDDLFIVGSWHLLPDLAARIRNDFVRYTTGRTAVAAPPITVSAGITLHGAKFPLYQAADEAHAALEAAKQYIRTERNAAQGKHLEERRKDALCFLSQVVGWEDYAHVAEVKDTLLRLDAQGAPRALLMTLQALYLQYRAGCARHRTRGGQTQFAYGPWVWRGAYMLTRLAERTGHEQVRADIMELRQRIIHEIQPPFIERAGLAARWAQLLVRGRKDAQ